MTDTASLDPELESLLVNPFLVHMEQAAFEAGRVEEREQILALLRDSPAVLIAGIGGALELIEKRNDD